MFGKGRGSLNSKKKKGEKIFVMLEKGSTDLVDRENLCTKGSNGKTL